MTNSGELEAWHVATRAPVRIRWAGGRITHLEMVSGAPPEEKWLAPALFDLQVNGYSGIDFQQDDLQPEELLSAVRGLRAAGCTRFFVALITDDWQRLMNRLRHLRSLRAQSDELQAAIAGWHIEGPFLSAEPGFHGAHEPEFMHNPTAADIQALRTITSGDPLLLTIAPERPGAIEAITLATSLGIKTSLGHTNA